MACCYSLRLLMMTVTLFLHCPITGNALENKLALISCNQHSTGYHLTYECTVVGISTTESEPVGLTIWRGTAFNCLSGEIALLLNQFTSDSDEHVSTHGECNNGSIQGYSVRAENGCYTSQLSVVMTSDLIGKSIECTYDNLYNTTTIGKVHLTHPEIILQSMIDINITSELCLESKTLTFTWEEVLGSTTTNYTILSSNCGSCPTTTTNTTVTCTDVHYDGGVCTFDVRTVACGNTHLSGEIRVMLIKGSVHTANSNILVIATSASLIVVCILCTSTFPIIYIIGKRIYRSRHEVGSGESTITVKGIPLVHQYMKILDPSEWFQQLSIQAQQQLTQVEMWPMVNHYTKCDMNKL